MATRFGVSPNQIALAWVLNQPFPTIAVIGSRTAADLDEAIAAQDLRLNAERVRWLADDDSLDSESL